MASELLKLLPYSLRQDPVLVAIAEAVEIQLKQAYQEAEDIYNLVDIDKMPEALLDLLAYEKHVDFYDVKLPVDQKRNLVKSSIKLHRLKGTKSAIEMVIDVLKFKGEVQEWFDYEGRPFYFRLVTEEALSPSKSIAELVEMVSQFKNVRSWLENITVHRKMDLGLNVGSAYPMYQQTKISIPTFKMDDLEFNNIIGIVDSKFKCTKIEIPHFTMQDNIQVHSLYGGVFSTYKKTTIAVKG